MGAFLVSTSGYAEAVDEPYSWCAFETDELATQNAVAELKGCLRIGDTDSFVGIILMAPTNTLHQCVLSEARARANIGENIYPALRDQKNIKKGLNSSCSGCKYYAVTYCRLRLEANEANNEAIHIQRMEDVTCTLPQFM